MPSRRRYYRRKRSQVFPRVILWVFGLLFAISFLQSLSPIELAFVIILVVAGGAGYIYYKNRRRYKHQSRLLGLGSDVVDVMDGVPFEEYVATVFQRLGYRVQTTPVSGDFGVDLIIARDNIRTAVQCKRYTSKIDLKAVQQAHAGMAHYRCDQSMVVTNSSFTKSAITLAQSTKCQLIDGTDLAKLVKSASLYS